MTRVFAFVFAVWILVLVIGPKVLATSLVLTIYNDSSSMATIIYLVLEMDVYVFIASQN